MARRGRWLVLVIALGATLGCAPPRHRLSFALEQRIMRETTLDDVPPGVAGPGDGVVRLIRTGKEAGLCSGALVSRRHVLTAAHCVVHVDANKELTESVIDAGYIHVELGGGYLPWGRVGVVKIRACDAYADDLAHDIAMLTLSKAVPDDVPIFELSYEMPEEVAIFALEGFGAKDTRYVPGLGPAFQTTRHIVTGPVARAWKDRVMIRMPGEPGDSGGPIVDTASGKIVSVVSRGRSNDEAEAPRRPSSDGDPTPLVGGPRLDACKSTIEAALLDRPLVRRRPNRR